LAHNELFTSLLIYYQSGTGNSYRAAVWMARTAQEKGLPATLIPLQLSEPGKELNNDRRALIGFVMPTHGFTAPWSMIKFILRLPKGRHLPAFCLATQGQLKCGPVLIPGLSATATFLSAFLLYVKGFHVRGVESINMPSNWMSLHPAQKPHSIRTIVNRGQPRAEYFITRLLNGKIHWLTASNLVEFIGGLILLPVACGYLLFGKTGMAKIYFANNACNGCGRCAEICAQKAIIMKNSLHPRPFWTYRCESCMRCMAFCPQTAIEVNQPWVIGLFFYIVMPLSTWLAIRVVNFAQLPYWWNVFIYGVVYLVTYLSLVAVSYLILFGLTQFKWLNAMLTHTTFSHYYRRYREPATQVNDLTRKQVFQAPRK